MRAETQKWYAVFAAVTAVLWLVLLPQKLETMAVKELLPLFTYLSEQMPGGYGEWSSEAPLTVHKMTLEDILPAENPEEWTEQGNKTLTKTEAQFTLMEKEQEAYRKAQYEEGKKQNEASTSIFVRHTEKQQTVDLQAISGYQQLIKAFYTIDKSTMIGSDQLDVGSLAAEDLTISRDSTGPQILIYHTHSQEAFTDSVPEDQETSIVGVGAYLAQLLTEEYGYEVLHHTASYDVPSRDDAYSVALPELEKLLAEYPQIQVIIDLHRDAVEEETRLVTELDGRPTAKVMFFNGLSRTRTTGNLSYLYNENLDSNLAFSFQMQKAAMEYYPGLTRKIYLKAYRYNMHLKPRTLLIELGAQNNTLEEALNACDPLAHLLDLVLSGETE